MFHCLTVGEDEGGMDRKGKMARKRGAGDTGTALPGWQGLLWWETATSGRGSKSCPGAQEVERSQLWVLLTIRTPRGLPPVFTLQLVLHSRPS